MDLCILNDGSATYIYPATSSTSTLDLSSCGPSLVLDYEWKIHEDLCKTDHFPVILTSCAVEEDAAPNRWNFENAYWLAFQRRRSHLPKIPPVSLPIFSLKQQKILYLRHASLKNFPKFHGLMKIARQQLKKERKRRESVCLFSNPVLSNVENCLLLRTKARHNNKRIRGDTPVLNYKMRTQKVWKAFRKVKGKGGSNSINHLKVKELITKTKTSGRSNSYKSV